MKTTCLLLLAVLPASVAVRSASAQPSNKPAAAKTPPAKPTPPNITTPAGLATSIQTSEATQNADNLIFAYGQSVTDPQLARTALAQLLANYYQLRNQATTAEQASQAVNEASLRFQVLSAAQNEVIIQQNQQLLQQNQRILDLLEKQAKAKAMG